MSDGFIYTRWPMGVTEHGLPYRKIHDGDFEVELPDQIVRVAKGAPLKGPDDQVIGEVTGVRVDGDAMYVEAVVRPSLDLGAINVSISVPGRSDVPDQATVQQEGPTPGGLLGLGGSGSQGGVDNPARLPPPWRLPGSDPVDRGGV